MKVNINLREEVKDMINDYSIDILCQKASKYFKCKCYSELHKSADPSCNICHGTGKVNSIERYKAIIEYIEASSKGSVKSTEVGDTLSQNIKLYVAYNTFIKEKDKIFTVGIHNDKVKSLHNVYEVTNVQNIRGDNGRTELLVVYAKLMPSYMNTATRIINKLLNHFVMLGKSYYV